MYAVVFHKKRQIYCIALPSIAKKHDFLTVIEKNLTYRQAERKIKELNRDKKQNQTI